MTVASSSSSEQRVLASREAPTAAAPAPIPPLPPKPAGLPLIEIENLGIWFRLHKKRVSLKRMLLRGRKPARPPVLWALRHVGFNCYEGQSVGIVGPNGAGKSTLCLVLAQILVPDEGRAIIRGKVSTLLTLGAGFNRDLSGRANILLYASYLGIPRRELSAKMNAIIDFSELGEFIDEPVRTYSSGMRARLGFSVATTLDPEILILDEVLAVGDRAFRAKSEQRMKELMSQSRLIVIVSHATRFLREVCTHCLWLDRGQMKMFGEAPAVLDAYEEATGGIDIDPASDPGMA